MTRVGVKDTQTVTLTGSRVGAANIDGVRINQLGNVITRSGFMTEIFRIDWPAIGITVRQINWVQLNPGGDRLARACQANRPSHWRRW